MVNGFAIDPNKNILYFDYEIIQTYDDNGREYMVAIKPNYHLNSVQFKMVDEILDNVYYLLIFLLSL